ncbi:hypothetical protein EG028_11950 [Chitinophaga barathri]|uniref:Uncharacterized protein n=1 Tax=Chitinophaga barathri TaxID=1647451 RepID=A0A3N4MKZ6_9BACT|nr:hypothetical protein EG028_11950 [Chitinophaga barathri]
MEAAGGQYPPDRKPSLRTIFNSRNNAPILLSGLSPNLSHYIIAYRSGPGNSSLSSLPSAGVWFPLSNVILKSFPKLVFPVFTPGIPTGIVTLLAPGRHIRALLRYYFISSAQAVKISPLLKKIL